MRLKNDAGNTLPLVSRGVIAFGLFVAMLALAIAPSVVAAQPGPPPPLPANAQVVAGGLINPRGFTWGPDGSLYVAEAGTPPPGFMPPSGPPMPGAAPVVNNNGRISRIGPDGTRTTVADGLPVAVGPIGDTIGPASVAFIGSTLYAIISAGPAHGHPEFAGGVYRVNPDGGLELVADTDAFNVANPPPDCAHCDTPGDELSNPYDMVALGGRLYITDGNKDVINAVDPSAAEGNRISRFANITGGGHNVLTGIAVGPDGSLYVSNLTQAPFRTGTSVVRRVTLGGGVAQVADGFSAATGVALSPGGSIYVSEIATTIPQPPFLMPPGRIVTRGKEGIGPVAASLMFPTILRWGRDGLYAAIFSLGGGPEGVGAIIRIIM